MGNIGISINIGFCIGISISILILLLVVILVLALTVHIGININMGISSSIIIIIGINSTRTILVLALVLVLILALPARPIRQRSSERPSEARERASEPWRIVMRALVCNVLALFQLKFFWSSGSPGKDRLLRKLFQSNQNKVF